MKKRRHHNNTGSQQAKQGECEREIKRIAKRYGIPINPSRPFEKRTVLSPYGKGNIDIALIKKAVKSIKHK